MRGVAIKDNSFPSPLAGEGVAQRATDEGETSSNFQKGGFPSPVMLRMTPFETKIAFRIFALRAVSQPVRGEGILNRQVYSPHPLLALFH